MVYAINMPNKCSEETKRKISEALSGVNHPLYGKHHSAEAKLKMSESAKHRPKISEETRAKLRILHSGKNNARYGIKLSAETRAKVSRTWFKKGDLHPNWLGNQAGKDAGRVRARKIYECPKGKEIHHIDGNPLNNDSSNIMFVSRKEHEYIDGRMEKLHKSNVGKHHSEATKQQISHNARNRIRDIKGKFI